MPEELTVLDVVNRHWTDLTMDRDGMISPEPRLMITDMGNGQALVVDHELLVLERVNCPQQLTLLLASIKTRRAALFMP